MPGSRDRGNAIEAPDWWLTLARGKLREEAGLVELGEKLAKLVKRSKPWSHSTLSRFRDGKEGVTQELALALYRYFTIPMPFYVPRSLSEAKVMQALAELELLDAPADDAARAEREKLLTRKLENFESTAANRSSGLQSPNEASSTAPSRGPRRVHRGGS